MKVSKWGKKIIALALALLMFFDQSTALIAPVSAEESVLPAEQQEVRIEPVALATDAPPAEASNTDAPETDVPPTEVAAAPQATPTTTEENTVADSGDETIITGSENAGADGEDSETGGGQELPTLSIPLVAGPLSPGGAEFAPAQRTLSIALTAPGSYALALSVPNDDEIEYLSISGELTDETGNTVAWPYFYVENSTYEDWQTGEMAERHSKNLTAFFTAASAGTYTLRISSVYPDEGLPETISAKCWQTVDAPRFDVDAEDEEYPELLITEPCYVFLTDIPDGCTVYYAFSSMKPQGEENSENYIEYDPTTGVYIANEARVVVYCARETAAGVLQSDTRTLVARVDMEQAECSVEATANRVEDGGCITFTTANPTDRVYYLITDGEWDDQLRFSEYLIQNGTPYTEPIPINGEADEYHEIFWATVTEGGMYTTWSTSSYFLIGTPPPASPVFTPDSNGTVTFAEPTEVTITSEAGTVLYYNINQRGETTEGSNTLTVTVDRDMQISARAYDAAKELYSDYTVTRDYCVEAEKTLRLTQSAVIETDGVILFNQSGERYTLNVQEAGAYQFRVTYNGKYYYSSYPVEIRDALGGLVAELPTGDWGSIRDGIVTLAVGEYHLALLPDQNNSAYQHQPYQLTIQRGLAAPTISPEGGDYTDEVEITLTHPDNTAELYYRIGYGASTRYTGPFRFSGYDTIYAWAQVGETTSDQSAAYYRVPVSEPTMSPEGGWFTTLPTLTLSHASPNAEIYYRIGYDGEVLRYTAPITLDAAAYVTAYAILNGQESATASTYYRLDNTPPEYSNYWRFHAKSDVYDNYIYGSAELTGTVSLCASNIYDNDSGMDHVDYYLKVEDGAYHKIGTAAWNEPITWDTSTVTGGAGGSVAVRLAAIAYDKVGNAPITADALDDSFDSDYAPTFHVNNAPCAPMDTFTAEPQVGKITLAWSRETALDYGDVILIYRATSKEALAENQLAEEYYSYTSYEDTFLTSESAAGSYYYGIRICDKRGILSEMVTTDAPVSPLADTEAPTAYFGFEENETFNNDRETYVEFNDNVSLGVVEAVFVAENGTETAVEGSPWTYGTTYASTYTYHYFNFTALDDGAYTLRVTAKDVYGNRTVATRTFVKDGTPPSAPTGLIASPIPGRVSLRWTAAPEADIVGYYVSYSETEDGTYYDVNYNPITETSFVYPSYGYLTPGDTCWFKIRSVDRGGNIAETAAVMGTAGKYNPQLRLVNAPKFGEDATVAFSGFQSDEYVEFYLDREESYRGYSRQSGEESEYTVDLDDNLRGSHTIRAVGRSSGIAATLRFTIAERRPTVTLNTATVMENGNFQATITDFPSYRYVYFYLDDATDASAPCKYYYPDETNAKTLYLSDLGNPAPGSYVLRAVEPQSGLVATANLTVTAAALSLRCDTESPAVGSIVSFYASGFADAEAELWLAGEMVGTVTRNYGSEHRFYNVRIPDLAPGETAVMATVIQSSTGKSASLRIAVSQPTPSLSVSNATVGMEEFTVEGSGFQNEYVDLLIDNVKVGSPYFYGSGSTTYHFGYGATAGTHSVMLRGQTSGRTASGSVTFTDTVQTLSLSPETPALQSALTLLAAGFAPSENVAFAMNGTALGSVWANGDGVASYTIDSLAFAPTSGSYIFTAVGQTGGRVAFAGTNGNLTLSYSGNPHGGSTLPVTVTGLQAGETVRVYLDHHTSDSVTANDSGAAEVRVAMPAGFSGNLNLTVWGGTSQRWGSAVIPFTAYAPTLTLSASSVALGKSVALTVSGFRPNAELRLLVDGVCSDTTLTLDANGSGTLNYALPMSGTVGAHTLGFFDPLSGTCLTKELTALAPSVTVQVPTTAKAGDTVTVTVSGVPDDETVTVTLGDLLPSEGTSFVLPANMAPGAYTVHVALAKSALVETALITVATPETRIEAVKAEHEATLTITASGFAANESLSLYFDHRLINASLSDCTTKADGTLSVQFALPAATLAGTHPLSAVGQTSGRVATTTVNIEQAGPMLSLSGLAEGKPGARISFTGANFTASGAYTLSFENELLLSDVSADENGEITGSFAIPSGFADGRYRIVATDLTTDETAIAFLRIDTTAPAAPTITVSPKKQSLLVSWDAPTDDDVASYTVTCTPAGGEPIELAKVSSSVTSLSLDMHDDSFPLVPGKSYTFAVVAEDRIGNVGAAGVSSAVALTAGDDAPEVTSVYSSGWRSIRVNGEWVTILTGNDCAIYAYAQDDQQLSSLTFAVAPENGTFGAETPVELNYSGNYSSLAHYNATLALDSTAYTDGLYTFRFTATDSVGLTHAYERRFYVDNTPTAAVSDLTVQESSNALIVSWNWTPGETGEVLDHYRVYYSSADEAEQYQDVAYTDGVKTCTIRRLTAGTQYTIRVTAVDAAGNESSWTTVYGTPIVDTEAPVITAVEPNDARLGKCVTFYITATDNAELDGNSVRAEINAGEGGSFVPFGARYYSGAIRAENLTYNGRYTLRFIISDLAGNESLPYTIEREFDTNVTAVSGLTAESAAGGIRVSWNKIADKDLIYYYVYRAAPGEDYRYWTALSPLKITEGSIVSWTDYDVKDDVTYSYKVIAVDDVDNRQDLSDAMSAEAQKGVFVTSASISPSENVKPGSVLHLSAQGFRGNENVAVYLDSGEDSIFWTYADENGIVSVDWNYVRGTGAGAHTLKLIGSRSGASASANFTCQPTALPAPAALTTTAGTMEIALQWESVDGAAYYRVYRAEDGGDMTMVADRIYGCSYTDKALTMVGDSGKIYTYAVAAVDRYDFEGARSDDAIDRPDADTVDPEITLFTSQRVGMLLRLFAEVSDDLGLGSVVFRYKPEGSGDDAYQTIREIAVDHNRRETTVSTEFDTSTLADGSYVLLVQVVDRAGRASTPLVRTVKLSSEKPAAPENLAAQAGQMRIVLSWQNAAAQSVDVARYNIYRDGGEGYTFLASTTLTTYTDTTVRAGASYRYQVTAVSDAEAESLPGTLATAVAPDADTVAPVISGFATPDGTRLAGKLSLAVLATDNVAVDHVDFFLVNDDSSETKLGTSDKGSLAIDTAEYKKEGTLTFRVRVYDAAGNSSSADVHYQVDNAAPAAPALTVAETELSVTLRWSLASTPKDLKHYRIYQVTGETYKLLTETANMYYTLQTSDEGKYCVTAVDDLGNESPYSNVETVAPGLDRTAPVIHSFAAPEVARTDATLTLIAEDNGEIASYRVFYRPLVSDELTGAVVPAGEWQLLTEGNWASLAEDEDGARVAAWNTLAVISTESGPEARFPDGLYELSLRLTDAAGNQSEAERRVTVANNPPAAPEGFRVDAGEWRLIVSWKPAAGNEAVGYTLYRKVNSGEYEKLTYTTANVYVDQNLDPTNQYFYMVAIENDLGKQGPTTADYSTGGILPAGVKTRPEPETSLPVILNMSPAQGSRFNAGLNLNLQVNDAVSLSTVEFWKAWIGESSAATVPADAVYENFATLDISDLQKELVETSESDLLGTELFVIKHTADTASWADGAWAIKVVVRNKGAEPAVQIKSFFKDSMPPAQPELTVTDPMVGGTLNLTWNVGSADVAYYKVLRSTSPDADPKDCELIAKPLSPVYTDTGLTNGTTYYYYVVVVDNAGNESAPSLRCSLAPTAVSDLGVYSVYTTPPTITAGRSNTLRASLRNNGNAAASGTVSFYCGETLLGSTEVTLAANTGSEASITWIAPAELPERIDITAVVVTTPDTDANSENNTFTGSDIRVNQPPVAKIVLPDASADGTYDSGAVLSFAATGSNDPDGSIVRFRWDFGNGKRGDYATSPTTYVAPGRYTVTLTVTDDLGATTETTEIITVGDCRPDLFVESVRWTPVDPEEGDVVTITATLGNKGLGDATLGFLTGFYIDNVYMGYAKTDVDESGVSIGVGKTVEVNFTYQTTAGTHVVKVVANDILNTLSETSKTNNTHSEVLSSQQVNFADVEVSNLRWDPAGSVFDTQSPFVYRVDVSNIGSAEAKGFSVSLYVDDEFAGRQTVPLLNPEQSMTLSFAVTPQIGAHRVEVRADDLNPCLIETNTENNIIAVTTDAFTVYYPELEVTDVTWRPTETTLTDGTSLLFTAKLTNVSTVNVTDSFRVSFTMDGNIFRTVTVDGIGAGEIKEVQAKWSALEGSHKLGVIVDPQHAVTDPDSTTEREITLPRLDIIYPNVCVTNVSYSPLRAEAGKPVSFLVTVTNNNVASAFKRFNVGLYVDGQAVSGAVIDGIRGFSTVPVVLTWTPKSGGNHTVRIVADSYGELKMDAPAAGTSRSWTSVIPVNEALTMVTHPSEKDQDNDFLAVLFSTSEEKITLTADLRHSANPNVPITPNEDGAVYYTLTRNGEIVGGREGWLRYDYVSGCFTVDVPIGSELSSGTYQLDFTGSCGADTVTAPTTNVKIVQSGNVTVETNKQTYQLGESLYVNGTFRYSDGTPVKNERVVLDYQLMPALKEPIQTTDENGKEILMRYQAEEIIFVQTDDNGAYSDIFTPFTGEAGTWVINAYGYEKMMGTGASTSVQVWGLAASPANLTIAASENSQFSKDITVRYPAPKNSSGAPLTGLTASLVQKSGSGISASLDLSTLPRTLAQGATASVRLNVSASLGCSETADFEIVFSTNEGAFAKSNVHLNIVPATPIPVSDQKSVAIGINPGDVVSRVLTITNKGKGTLNGLKATTPASIPWVTAGTFGKTTLLPNESTTVTVSFAPGEAVNLGQYQDTLVISDATGKFYANVGLSAEVTALKTGGISLRVSDDVGTLVSNATVTLISRDEYTSMTGGVESTYYESFSARTDENGIAQLYDKPLGVYDLVITATGREKYVGECEIMPSVGAPFTEITMKNLPVQIEWTVVPTTIVDEYEIKLELTFGAHIPTPSFGFNPPWVNIPKHVTEPVYVEANVVNTGLIALTDVVASVVRQDKSDTGISIVGGGYIGEIAAQSSARIRLLVQPGVYQLPYGTNAAGLAANYIKLEGSYVSFDPDTGLPVDPAPMITGALPLYNPSTTPVTVAVRLPENDNKTVEETLQLPEGQMEEIRYIAPERIDKEKELEQDGGSVYEIVKLSLDQTATLERQAFDATLKVTNGYPTSALNNLRVDVLVKDENGVDVSSKNFIIATGLQGIADVDGNGSLASGSSLTATWQIIPGSGLGGTDPEGKTYYASALVSYYVNGQLVQTETEGVPITILPQPQLELNYFVPHNILSNTPFRLGVTVENYGFGEAMNLNINSGQLKIESNQSGMITDFEILESSFGSQSGSEFKLAFGNVPAATREFNEQTGEWDIVPGKVSGYWTVRWNMPASEETYEGEFREFKAALTHKDYKGVQLNPLITAVHTAIIGKDGVLASEDGKGGLTLVNEGLLGFVDYLLDLSSGLRVPIYVPDSLSVTKAYNGTDMIVHVPEAKSTSARYQVLMIPEPEGCGTISAVSARFGSTTRTISAGNYWKDFGYIYIVDEIPTAYDASHNVQYAPADYTIVFGNAAQLKDVNYSRFVYVEVEPFTEGAIQLGRGTTGYYLKEEAFYDTGINPDVGDTDVRLMATIDNLSRDMLNGYVVFTATPNGSDTPEFRSGDIPVAKVQPYAVVPVYCSDWVPQKGTTYTITAELHENGGKLITTLSAKAVINNLPYSHAGADIANAVMGQPVRFDGSASYDKDGYIASFVWDFGDGESGFGPTPTHTYQKAGTYRASLYVSDNNLSTTYPYSRDKVTDEIIAATKTEYNYFSEIQVTVLADCPDLFVNDLAFSNSEPSDGETVTVTATIQNGTLPNDGGLTSTGEDAHYLVGFYQNDTFIGFKEVTGDLAVGATTAVSFSFKAIGGAQKISAVVNDVGRNIREVNYDNNRRDAVLHGSATDFADLAVTSFTASLTDGDTVSWGQSIDVSAVVKNTSSTAAGSFKVLLYDNDTLVGSQLIESLSASAVETVKFVWRPVESGAHTLKLVADGPISAVVELDETNNTAQLDYTQIVVRYPDLVVKELTSSLNGSTVAPGQNIVLSALVENLGPGDAVLPTTVAFYAGKRLIGTAETHTIKAGESELVSMLWQDPAISVSTISAVADAYETLTERAEGNNRSTLTLAAPLSVSTTILEITDVATIGAAHYGDVAQTTVTLKNSGDRSVDEPFAIALYVGAKRVGTEMCESLAAGESTSFVFPWTAEQSGEVMLRVFADAESKLVLENRSLASVSKTLTVAPGLVLTGGAESSAYCVGDTVLISVSAFSSSAVYRPIAVDSITATVNEKEVALTYDAATGTYTGSTTADAAGNYTLTCSASFGVLAQTLTSTFTVAEDFRVTLDNTDQQSYNIGETIAVTGAVKTPAGVGIAGVPVTVTAVGSDRFAFTAMTTANGSFTCDMTLPEGVGGAFSLRASAVYGDVTHLSDRVAFYVDGLHLALDDQLTVTQGYEAVLSGYLNNPGVTAATVDAITVTGLPNGLTYTVASAPNGNLTAASGEDVRIVFTASNTLAPGEYEITVQSGTAKQTVTVTCVEARHR